MKTRIGLAALLLIVLSACGGGLTPSTDAAASGASGTITLYTSTTQETVDALLAAFAEAHPAIEVEVFRAPTGEINARIAAERREGTVRGDVLWLSDPLSIQQFDADGLLRAWTPSEVESVPEAYRAERFWGTRLLNVVLIHGSDVEPAPTAWADLTDPAYADSVAIMDPGFAGSAFGALGYFATSDDFGFDYYRDLAANGAVQLSAPDEVVTGVAEGRYAVGMTLEAPAAAAVANGSPIEVVWPDPGAIAIYSPIAVFEDSAAAAAAEAFVDFVLSEAGQTIIGASGFQPIREGIEGPPIIGDQVAPEWAAIFDRQAALLEEYRLIFGE